MSVECSECESDARAGHDPGCSRSPESEVKRLKTALEQIRDEAYYWTSPGAGPRMKRILNITEVALGIPSSRHGS